MGKYSNSALKAPGAGGAGKGGPGDGAMRCAMMAARITPTGCPTLIPWDLSMIQPSLCVMKLHDGKPAARGEGCYAGNKLNVLCMT